jgi:F0F1-type ATP synthase membrane subunit c/vacuolar-type H+-ATPase subunit K
MWFQVLYENRKTMSDNRLQQSRSQKLFIRAMRHGTALRRILISKRAPLLVKFDRNFRSAFFVSLCAMTSKSKVSPVVAAKHPAVSKTFMCIGFILFGIPSAILAANKGFKPWRWLLAFGAIGLIVVCCLSSAKSQGISAEETAGRAAKADNIGAIMCGLNLALGAVSLLILLANN